MSFADRLRTALASAEFTEEERTYATQEQCGTFALALYDLLIEMEQEPAIVAFGQDPAWGRIWLANSLGYKMPGLIRHSHLNHIAIRLQDSFFDIKGAHTPFALAATYDANGMVLLERSILRRKIGSSPSRPLYFDGSFYFDTRQRLYRHLSLDGIHL